MVLTMALLTTMPVEVAVAQTSNAPVSGPRIRVTAPSFSGERLVGVLAALDETTLTLRQGENGSRSLVVPRAAITKLEASRHRSRKAAGAAIGLLIGLGTAAVVGLVARDDCTVSPGDGPWGPGTWWRSGALFCLDKRDKALLTGILVVPPAMLLGLVASPGERWEISTTDRLRIAVAPTRGNGVRAALAIRF